MTIKEAEKLLTKKEIAELRKEHAKNIMRAKIREEGKDYSVQYYLEKVGLWNG